MDDSTATGLVWLLFFAMCYFMPTLVAHSRGREGWSIIGWVNLVIGWTVIGWFVLLIAAFTGEGKKAREERERMLKLLEERQQT